MKGDFSRIRFNPAKQYTSVLKQQGRVDLDSDANEQCAIDERLRATINTDVIGLYGGPEDYAGFAIQIVGDKIVIGAGRYYVGGLLVENPHPVSYDEQSHLLDPTNTAADLLSQLQQLGSAGTIQFVLEVWQRLVTALDDPCLLDPALGQADTTARVQTVWRVVGTVIQSSTQVGGLQHFGDKKEFVVGVHHLQSESDFDLAQASAISQLAPCCQVLYQENQGDPHTGGMGAGLSGGGTDCGCQPIAAAGYQGLENQLYRVEIHKGGDLSSATFKWSRENGSVVTQVTQVGANSPVITVSSLGPDANLGFQAGQWVELYDDTYIFGETPNQPGPLFQIAQVTPATLQVTMTTPVFGIDTNRNARMRRWDQVGDSATDSGIPVSSTPIPLENGIEVNFTDGQFQSGDYWTIPARTADGQIDWPPCGGNQLHFQPPAFSRIHRAPVACVQNRLFLFEDRVRLENRIKIEGMKSHAGATLGDNYSRYEINDCRLLFPPLTALNAETTPPALHVTAVNWTNDDIITTDTLLEKGLSVTFDQPTTCPWGGGNFMVTLEPPLTGAAFQFAENFASMAKATFKEPAGTDCFLRTVIRLDPPFGITVSGNTVSWLVPTTSGPGGVNYGAWELLALLNILLSWQQPKGYARVRVRLIGGAIYGDGTDGNIYLDGQSFGETSTRSMDASGMVILDVPSGNSARVSDYEGWFYLAPTVYVTSVIIQGLNGAQVVRSPLTAVKVNVDFNNNITGLQIGETASITAIQAVITLSYPPVSDTPVALTFTGQGAGSVVTIASSVTIPAGQASFTTPINIVSNPGAVTDTVTLVASVQTAVTTLPVATPPTLAITGMTPPQKPPA